MDDLTQDDLVLIETWGRHAMVFLEDAQARFPRQAGPLGSRSREVLDKVVREIDRRWRAS